MASIPARWRFYGDKRAARRPEISAESDPVSVAEEDQRGDRGATILAAASIILLSGETVAMFDMTGYAELKRLLTEVEAIEGKLMPNELEMLRSLVAKYVEPQNPDPFDVTSLNVLLRNVEIRKGYRFDPKRDGGRVINLPRRGVSKKN